MVCGLAGIPQHTDLHVAVPPGGVMLVAPYAWAGADQLYTEILPRCNREAFGGAPYYEGIVAKRGDSKYPHQLRDPDVEFPFWLKHRWQF